MSLSFNDITAKKGIIQQIEKELGFSTGAIGVAGDIAGNAAMLADVTADVNVSMDDYVAIAIPASGRWQFDDSNQSDYPIISTNLVSGQRDYAFTVDGSGNLILGIYKVLAANPQGLFVELSPVDVQTSRETMNFTNGLNVGGVPYRYDKTANAIFLDLIPNYSYNGGLKIYINREATYFSTGDTIRKPGIPGLHHEYLVIKAALKYSGRHSMANYKDLYARVQAYEEQDGKIQSFFSTRNIDETLIISGMPINFR